MKVLMLTSFCKNESCTDDLPCEACLKQCNIIEVFDPQSVFVIDKWNHLDAERNSNGKEQHETS